jgi:uncharacterized protein (TIGR02145 family)
MLKQLFVLLFLSIVVCMEISNPYDRRDPNYVKPSFGIDSTLTTLLSNDTIGVSSGSIFLEGNDVENQFRWQLDQHPWSAWEKNDKLAYTIAVHDLDSGWHTLSIQTCYDPKEEITSGSIRFFRAMGARISSMCDTLLNIDESTPCTLWVQAGGNEPRTYQWFAAKQALAGSNNDTLILPAATPTSVGNYYCRAANQFGADTSRVIEVKFNSTFRGRLHYQSNGAIGELPVDNTQYQLGFKAYVLDATKLHFIGNHFQGWLHHGSGGDKLYQAGDSLTIRAALDTLWAQWKVDTLEVCFQTHDSRSIETLRAAYNTTIEQPHLEATSANTAFGGWYRDEEYKVPFDFSSAITDNLCLHAKWISLYRIVYQAHSASGEMPMDSSRYVGGESAVVQSAEKLFKQGFDLVGWKRLTGDTTKTYRGGDTIVVADGDIYLQARWQRRMFNLTFSKNDNSVRGKMDALRLEENSVCTLPKLQYTKPGWSFSGWAAQAGGDSVYADAGEYVMAQSHDTLYATWRANNYQVHYNAGDEGVTGSMVAQTIACGSTDTLHSNVFRKEGWNFVGWSRLLKGVIAYVDTEVITMDTTDLNLYAIWTQTPQHSITASVIGGVGGTLNPKGSIAVPQGTDQTFFFSPAVGYEVDAVIIDGVEVGSDVKSRGSYTFQQVSEEHSIRVRYRVKQFTLSASVVTEDGGAINGPIVLLTSGIVWEPQGTRINSGSIVSLLAPDDTRYRFVGWFAGAEQLQSSPTITLTIDTTIAVAAHYAVKMCSLTVAIIPPQGGSVLHNSVYRYGTSVGLTANANPFYNHVLWSGAAGGGERTVSVKMEGNKSVSCIFDTLAPTVLAHPHDTSVFYLDGVTFSVAVEGIGPFTYQWLKDGQVMNGANRATCSIQAAAADTVASHRYRCRITNPSNKSTLSNEAVLRVTSTIKDADDNVYNTVRIGNQIWIVQNLRTTSYANGEPIKHVPDNTEWGNMTTPGYCFYDNSTNPDTMAKWGALYNGYAVEYGNLAPKGWRVPSNEDFDTLISYLGHNGFACGDLGHLDDVTQSMAAQSDWWPNEDVYCGTGYDLTRNNSSGFTALPAGHRTDGFTGKRDYAFWWTTTPVPDNTIIRKQIDYYYEFVTSWYTNKSQGLSVRLVRDVH